MVFGANIQNTWCEHSEQLVLTMCTYGADIRKILFFHPFSSLSYHTSFPILSHTLYPSSYILLSLYIQIPVYSNLCISVFTYTVISTYLHISIPTYSAIEVLAYLLMFLYSYISKYLCMRLLQYQLYTFIPMLFAKCFVLFGYESMQICQNMWVFSCLFAGKPLSLCRKYQQNGLF